MSPVGNGYVGRQSPAVDASRFAMTPRDDIPRSAFDTEYSYKTTFDGNILVPVYIDEVIPGDSHRVNMTAFCRLATPIVPPMDTIVMESFFFFVPTRLVWSNFRRFMGEQLNPADTTEFLIPQIPVNNATNLPGFLADWFGIRNSTVTPINVNALPFRCYNLIHNEWFRDEDLQTPLNVGTGTPLGDGPDSMGDYAPMKRGKRWDYFTSCRPWPQKPGAVGDTGSLNGTASLFYPGGTFSLYPTINAGLGVGAPVTGIGSNGGAATAGGTRFETGKIAGRAWANEYVASTASTVFVEAGSGGFPNVRVLINDIRTANQIQILMERNARGGTRYTEIVREHFGVASPDSRLQRPEYLGGGKTFLQIAPVAQTSASGVAGTTTVLGELAGVGTGIALNHGFSHSFVEHGYVIGLVECHANLTYQQGTNRMWFKRGRYDFYWPSLAHLGEQAVLSKELFCDGSASDNNVFGYQERWAEYKYKPSIVTGRFRTGVTNSLDIWHFAENFSSRPVLNNLFIQNNAPIDRVLQVQGLLNEQFLFDALFDIRRVRPMPMYSIPGLGPRL